MNGWSTQTALPATNRCISANDFDEDTDVRVLDHVYISIVSVQFDITAHHAIPILNGRKFEA
jgi:hypothetical protein